MKYSQTYSLTNLGLFLNLLMFGADLVVNKSASHAGAILLLRVNFRPFVLLHSTYNFYSVFLIKSDLVGVKKNIKL